MCLICPRAARREKRCRGIRNIATPSIKNPHESYTRPKSPLYEQHAVIEQRTEAYTPPSDLLMPNQVRHLANLEATNLTLESTATEPTYTRLSVHEGKLPGGNRSLQSQMKQKSKS